MSNNVKTWISRSAAGFITLAVGLSALAKMAHLPKMVDAITGAGIPGSAIIPIAFLELACLALYLFPRTMVLGAVMLTGFFGGAIVVHIIGKESVLPLIVIGLLVWGGIYFRVPVLQDLLPLRKRENPARDGLGARGIDAAGSRSAGAYRTS